MTVDFICELLAEWFDSPCNYSPMDEQMFKDNYCESHCGKITDAECWKRYFEKMWADRKTESNSEIPNNCECDTCKYGEDKHRYAHICNECGVGINNYEPKDEPTISKMEQVEDEPQTATEIAKAIVHKMIDDAVIAEDAYPDLRKKMHDAVERLDEYYPSEDERSE